MHANFILEFDTLEFHPLVLQPVCFDQQANEGVILATFLIIRNYHLL